MGVYSNTEILAAIDSGAIVCEPFNPRHVSEASLDFTLGYYFYKQEFDVIANKLFNLDKEKYAEEPFVTLLPKGTYPHTKWVYGTNHCMLNVLVDERSGKGVIFSAIDNLGKGAAGQGIQNMNLLLGLDEETGLKDLPVFP